MAKIKWSEKVTNKEFERTGGKRTLLNNILHRNASWMGDIPRINYLLHDSIERVMTEVKGIGRRTQLFDGLRKRRRY